MPRQRITEKLLDIISVSPGFWHSIALSRFFLPAVIAMMPLMSYAIDTSTRIFSPQFKTLRIITNDNFIAPDVLRLGTNDILTISFDEIADDYRQLQYSLMHCNSDWQPSQLVESEYMQGFNIADVDDYAFSSNTFVHYVNYEIQIPGNDMMPFISGNYLLQVFDRDNPSDILLQARFRVSENAVPIKAEATSRTDRSFDSELQQVNFALSNSGDIIPNPYQDLIITVRQNRRPETERTVRNPFRVQGSDIIFEHNRDLIFPASNEYRRFETVRADYPGMHVDSVAFGGSNYHAYLSTDLSRKNASYSYDQTQAGRFFIREYNATDSNLGADYITVHFSLDMPDASPADVIMLDGDFASQLPESSRRLHYDPATSLFHTQIPLKQGSYNYQYVMRMPDGTLSTAPTEGNKYETGNEYDINVFLRTPGSRADRLLSTATVTF